MADAEPSRWPDGGPTPASPRALVSAPRLASVPGQRRARSASLPDPASVPVYAEIPEGEEASAAAMRERWTERVTRVARLTAGRPAVPPRAGYRPGDPDAGSRRPEDPGVATPRPGRRAEARTSFRSHVTARGALLGMFLLCLLACLIGGWRQLDILDGLAYCAGCVLMPVYARRDAQLRIVVAAPAVFLLALVITQALTAQGNSAHGTVFSILEGTLLTLADVAPWLFAGTAVCVVIALTQGLPQCLRDARAAPMSRAGSGRRHSALAARDPWAQPAGSAETHRTTRGPGQRTPGA